MAVNLDLIRKAAEQATKKSNIFFRLKEDVNGKSFKIRFPLPNAADPVPFKAVHFSWFPGKKMFYSLITWGEKYCPMAHGLTEAAVAMGSEDCDPNLKKLMTANFGNGKTGVKKMSKEFWMPVFLKEGDDWTPKIMALKPTQFNQLSSVIFSEELNVKGDGIYDAKHGKVFSIKRGGSGMQQTLTAIPLDSFEVSQELQDSSIAIPSFLEKYKRPKDFLQKVIDSFLSGESIPDFDPESESESEIDSALDEIGDE